MVVALFCQKVRRVGVGSHVELFGSREYELLIYLVSDGVRDGMWNFTIDFTVHHEVFCASSRAAAAAPPPL